MKFKLFLAVLGALASGQVVGLSQEPVTTQAQPTQEEIDKLFFDKKDIIFGAKTNPFCKSNDPFCPSQCHYQTSIAYNQFTGVHNPWSLIPDRSFKDEKELNKWACSQTKDTYLIAHRPGCPACAVLLAALETRAQSLREANLNVYKINPYENRPAFSDKDWKFDGTPTVWKIMNGSVYKMEHKSINYYNEFIAGRKENKIAQSRMDFIKTNIKLESTRMYNHGFGYFKHDEKVAAAAVCAALCYGGYKGYKLAKKYYNKKS